jgi:hypothetical protein
MRVLRILLRSLIKIMVLICLETCLVVEMIRGDFDEKSSTTLIVMS